MRVNIPRGLMYPSNILSINACNMILQKSSTQHKPSYPEGKKPVSLFNTFVVFLIVNASSTSLVGWSRGLEANATWCSTLTEYKHSSGLDHVQLAKSGLMLAVTVIFRDGCSCGNRILS